MLSLIAALFVIITSVMAIRYYFAKTRFAEAALDDVIARKLATSPLQAELSHFKEQNAVMRNLLLDLVENEASIAGIVSETDKAVALNARTQRRREIFGEAVFLLQQTASLQSAPQPVKAHPKQRISDSKNSDR
ncbi:MAG: hypothetical protein U5N27_04410 [Rhizobium sp.]|nr:hypothetical protein [Rhizobium sp.]